MSAQSLNILVIGPLSPSGEQLLSDLAHWPAVGRLEAVEPGEPPGATYPWRGGAQRTIAAPTQGGWDVVFLAAPAPDLDRAGALVIALPGAGLGGAPTLAEDAVNAAAGAVVRCPDPLAALVAGLVRALGRAAEVLGVEVSSYEAASGAGRAGMDELRDQTVDLLNFRQPSAQVFRRRLAFDVIPGEGTEAGDSPAERAFAQDLAALCPGVSALATRVQVSAFVGLAATLRVQLAAPISAESARAALEAADVEWSAAPGFDEAVGADALQLGRLRVRGDVLHLWLVGDDTRRGSANNALALARALTAR